MQVLKIGAGTEAIFKIEFYIIFKNLEVFYE